jgi:hypothetical protein
MMNSVINKIKKKNYNIITSDTYMIQIAAATIFPKYISVL